MKKISQCLLFCGLLSTGFASFGAEEDVHRPRKPPKEAIEACTDRAENDTVTFIGRFGEELSASCRYIDEMLIAVPNAQPGGGKKQQG
ncbi:MULTISPECIES: hypothetical protein [unclassified Alteromonas]|uniref:hypothetical protein n=1 Tax=unclassified Alteromonas TaxID=2614992 RepID=UPI0019224731|nr:MULTISPECIES: hypothetical protein [unclassified Alteromonas]